MVLRPRLAEEWPTEIEVVRLDMSRTPLSVLASLARGRRFLRSYRPDIVHSHSFHANFVARLLKLLGSWAPVLSTVHSVSEGGKHRMLAYRLTDFLSVRTTAVSAAAAERYVLLKAVQASKCSVVPNGIDAAEFAPDATRRASTRAADHRFPPRSRQGHSQPAACLQGRASRRHSIAIVDRGGGEVKRPKAE